MKYILHDLPRDFAFPEVCFEEEKITLISAVEPAAYCKGCFGCWLKTPGHCVFADRLESMGEKLIQAEELIIVSKCVYGGYSPEIKRIIDRCIPGVMPFFVYKNGEMHHAARYANQMKLRVFFYTEAGEEEQALAQKLVAANGLNFWASETQLTFVDREQLAEVLV